MQQERLKKAIEEGVSKGVPMDFIAYSLKRAGWPQGMVDEVVETWLRDNGRTQKTTEFTEWLRKYYRQAKPAIALMVILNTIASAIALLQPWPVKLLADSVFGPYPAPGPLRPYTHSPKLILIVSGLTLLIFFLGQAFGVIKDYMLLRIDYWLNRSIKEEAFRHILHLPLYHEGRLPKGDYIYRQNEVTNSLSDLILNTTSEIIGSVILIIGVTAIMLALNAKLTLFTIFVIPFLIISVRIFGPVMARLGQALTKLFSQTSSLIAESIDNAEAVQAFSLQERQVQKLKDLWMQTYRISRRGLLWGKAFQFSNGLVVILGTSIVIYVGGTEALNGQFSLGSLLIFMTYLGYLIGPIQDITSQITIRRQKLVNVGRVYEVLSDHEGAEHLREGKTLPRVQGRVQFQNVSYVARGVTILDQMSLTVEPGEKVGIIGPSGSGKSTLLRLLDLYIEPTAGRILIDGHDIQTVSLQDLRRNVAWISQSPQLFATSILENMRDGDINRQITPEEIRWAEQAANISEFVDKLPMGIESIAGEGGTSLSGGQRQRISIARALLKNAPIICMDEPTSALDDKSEKLIHDSIGSLIQDKTVLLVTHRLPLLGLMDRVYVLQDGQLVDVEELGGIQQYAYQLQVTGQL
jgi:ATP-binding cassette subfamily B protein/subfamily B ATP-binding cassette protein MsbA